MSADTILRLTLLVKIPKRKISEELGADYAVLRKEEQYSIILVDLQRLCRIDLLADREKVIFVT